MTLSKNRAMTVSNYLVERGVSATRLTTEWYGPDKPIADNSTVEGRAKNRRVNIAIVPNEEMKQQAIKEAGEN
jgi:outer membrane protein OmpA-like peptidoglycan-associated protein